MKILHVGSAYGYWGDLAPNCLDDESLGQVGGGETAMLNACFELAALGHDVTCSFRCKSGRYRGVRFMPGTDMQQLAWAREWDAIVSWDDAETMFPLIGNDGAMLVCANQMNDISPVAHGNDQLRWVSPSRTHGQLMAAQFRLPIERMSAIPNAVSPSWFDFSAKTKRDPNRVVYASSPDRGLHHILNMWPEILRAEPAAHLHVYYEIDRWIETVTMYAGMIPEMHSIAAWVDRMRRKYADPAWRVTFHGSRHPRALVRDLCRSGVIVYPCDTIFFTEGFGTTPLLGYVAGCYPVITDTDAFAEVYGTSFPLTGAHGEPAPLVQRARIDSEFAPRVVAAIRTMRGRGGAWAWSDEVQAQNLAHRISWARVGRLWERVLRGERVWWPEPEDLVAA